MRVSTRRTSANSPSRRRGTVLISVMVALALIAALSATWLKISIRQRSQLRIQQQRMQAACLADSGLDRAAARLAADPGYRGETWKIAAASFGGRSGANVEIEVTPDAARPEARRVRAVADFPDSGPGRVRRSQERLIELPKPGNQP